MANQKLMTLLVDTVSRALEERIRRLSHMSLGEIAEIVEQVLCNNWESVETGTDSVKLLGRCEVRVEDVGSYIEYAVEEAKRISSHLVDLAMESLAKHVESLPEGLYSRLSWLLVSHSARVANRLQKLASLMKTSINLSPLIELSITLIALRAAALYRLLMRLEPGEIEKLIENLEAFIAACDLEEDTLIEKLKRGMIASVTRG